MIQKYAAKWAFTIRYRYTKEQKRNENGIQTFEHSDFLFLLYKDLDFCQFKAVVDRTEPNLPNTEASVRFGRIQKYRTESFR